MEKNQYPPEFYDEIINSTLEKIIQRENEVQNFDQHRDQAESKEVFVLEYRENVTDNFIKQLRKCGAPVQPIVTLRKLKTTLPSLKPAIKKELKSGVIYKISCPGCSACYVCQTGRHVITRFKEHRGRKDGAVRTHFWYCCRCIAEFDSLEIIWDN